MSEVVKTTVAGVRVYGFVMFAVGFGSGFAACVLFAAFVRLVLP